MPREDGFSLVELLVAIAIVGILAALAIPQFTRQSEKGQDAEAMSLARDLATQVESCFVERDDYARCDSAAEIPGTGYTWGEGRGEVQVLRDDLFGEDVVAAVATSKTGTIFAVLRSLEDRRTSRACFVPSGAYPTGACRQGGPFGEHGLGTW